MQERKLNVDRRIAQHLLDHCRGFAADIVLIDRVTVRNETTYHIIHITLRASKDDAVCMARHRREHVYNMRK